jgi:hypothetical protein
MDDGLAQARGQLATARAPRGGGSLWRRPGMPRPHLSGSRQGRIVSVPTPVHMNGPRSPSPALEHADGQGMVHCAIIPRACMGGGLDFGDAVVHGSAEHSEYPATVGLAFDPGTGQRRRLKLFEIWYRTIPSLRGGVSAEAVQSSNGSDCSGRLLGTAANTTTVHTRSE